MTIDHASLSRRSIVPPPNRDTSTTWAPITFFAYDTYTFFCLSYALPVSLSVAMGGGANWQQRVMVERLGGRTFTNEARGKSGAGIH